MLKVYGRGASWLIFCVNNLARLYAGALCHFTTGLIGWSVLCIFIGPLMEDKQGFKLTYFHLDSCGISTLLSFIVFLIWIWNVLFWSVADDWKLFSCKMFCILDSYCGVGRVNIELPLSARVNKALLFWSLVCIYFIILASGCVCLWLGMLWCCKLFLRSATSFLKTSRSEVG